MSALLLVLLLADPATPSVDTRAMILGTWRLDDEHIRRLTIEFCRDGTIRQDGPFFTPPKGWYRFIDNETIEMVIETGIVGKPRQAKVRISGEVLIVGKSGYECRYLRIRD